MKYKSRPFSALSEPELLLHGKALLSKIHVITGWTIPNSPELLTILVDQFVKTLIEKYPKLNTDEVEYAFRQQGTAIQDWGKAMNLNLIDSVLEPYTALRFRISEDERRIKEGNSGLEQKIFTQEELDDSAREDAERQYQGFLKGFELKGLPINEAILKKDGLLKDGESVLDFFKRRALKGSLNIYVQGVS